MRYPLLRSLTVCTTLALCCPAEVAGQSASPRYEFRGAWIATVDNIDWPSRKGLPADSQRAEFIRLLDMHRSNGMNAVIMQVRPAADAFYPSPYEPWSEWLTGEQGRAPEPYYDPLAFMVEETHRRGMEFHAWLNPYRAVFNLARSSVAPKHITRERPEWFLDYGDKRYFDPGHPEAQAFVTKVVADIVRRYPVDAIHFDDYFYPYRLPGRPFPDTATYRRYGHGRPVDDWRRSNVDSIIVSLQRAIRRERPDCRFGISPFGVWRNRDKDPRGSDTRAGQTNYDDLYADIRLWLEKDWIDYVVPQLYWEFEHQNAPFEPLLDWWSRNSFGKPCYIGLGFYRAGSNAAWRDRTLISRQLAAIRSKPNIHGAVYFSSKSFFRNPLGWNDTLRRFYRFPALIPPVAGLAGPVPASPRIVAASGAAGERVRFRIQTPAGSGVDGLRQIAVYACYDARSPFSEAMLVATQPFSPEVSFEIDCPASADYLRLHVTYVDAANRESAVEGPGAATLVFVRKGAGAWERVGP